MSTLELDSKVECKSCHEKVDVVTADGLCRNCTDDKLINMKCMETDCFYTWQSPGIHTCWCPMCGSSFVTSCDKTVDEWIKEKKNAVS